MVIVHNLPLRTPLLITSLVACEELFPNDTDMIPIIDTTDDVLLPNLTLNNSRFPALFK